MHPINLTAAQLSYLTALGQMPKVKRPEDVALVLAAFEGLSREVAAILLDDPSGDTASEEARAVAGAIRAWGAEGRRRAAGRTPRRYAAAS